MEKDIMWRDGSEPVLIELDERRRTSLGKVGHKEHTRYLVEEHQDGTLIWRPAVVMPADEVQFMREFPEEYAKIRWQQAHPDPDRLGDRPPRRVTKPVRRDSAAPKDLKIPAGVP